MPFSSNKQELDLITRSPSCFLMQDWLLHRASYDMQPAVCGKDRAFGSVGQAQIPSLAKGGYDYVRLLYCVPWS